MKKITMDKEYTYRTGERARILCIDRNFDGLPVISVKEDGSIYAHTSTGSFLSSNLPTDNDLIEVWTPTKGEWCLFTDNHEAYILRKFEEINHTPKRYVSNNNTCWKYCYKFEGNPPNETKEVK